MRYATCHPDQKYWSRGMCKPCYVQAKNRVGFVRVGRALTPVTCGHPERRHAGHGMCQSCFAKNKRATNPRDKQERKNGELERRYGISLMEFEGRWAVQGKACALCHRKIELDKDRNVDHCHQTGDIRGILCFTCNKALGMLGDTIEDLERAVAYLKGELPFAEIPKPPRAKRGVFIEREFAL
jgi:hypothetical protein